MTWQDLKSLPACLVQWRKTECKICVGQSQQSSNNYCKLLTEPTVIAHCAAKGRMDQKVFITKAVSLWQSTNSGSCSRGEMCCAPWWRITGWELTGKKWSLLFHWVDNFRISIWFLNTEFFFFPKQTCLANRWGIQKGRGVCRIHRGPVHVTPLCLNWVPPVAKSHSDRLISQCKVEAQCLCPLYRRSFVILMLEEYQA